MPLALDHQDLFPWCLLGILKELEPHLRPLIVFLLTVVLFEGGEGDSYSSPHFGLPILDFGLAVGKALWPVLAASGRIPCRCRLSLPDGRGTAGGVAP